MNAKKIAGTIISISIEIILVALVIILVYNGASKAYTFGFSVFGERAISSEPGREIDVTIDSKLSAYELGELLKEKGLIRDAKVFYIQMKLMSINGKVNSGEYTLSTAMTPEDIINTITMEPEDSEEEE